MALRPTGTAAAASRPPAAERAQEFERVQDDAFGARYEDERASAELVREIRPRSIDVECVAHGALMRVGFGAGVSLDEALDYLRRSDPNVKFKTDFPAKGGFGPKETKLARVLMIGVRCGDNGKFIEMSCSGGGDDFKVSVGKNHADAFVGEVEKLGKLSAKQIDKLRKAFDEKGEALAVLEPGQQFGVKYWATDDGKRRFADGYQAEAPADEEKKD